MPTFVQGKATENSAISNGATLAFGSNVTAGNTLIFMTPWYGAFTLSLTDSQGNTWTDVSAHPAIDGLASYSLRVFTAVAGSSGANTITFAANGGVDALGSGLAEVSGLQASPFDKENSHVNTASPSDTGAITPSTNGQYIFCLYSRNGVVCTYTNTANFTVRATSASNSSQCIADYTQPTAGAITPDINSSASSSYKVWGMVASFKASAAAAPARRIFPGIIR